MAIKEIFIHNQTYKVACNDDQVEHLVFLSKRLSERIKKKSKITGGNITTGSSLLLLAALELEDIAYKHEGVKNKGPIIDEENVVKKIKNLIDKIDQIQENEGDSFLGKE